MYRMIHLQIGTDPKVINAMSLNAQHLFLWSMFFPFSHACGLYNISFKAAAEITKLSEGQFMEAMRELRMIGSVDFDLENNGIWVKNMMKHQGKGANFTVGTWKHLETVHSKRLVQDFKLTHPEFKVKPSGDPRSVRVPTPSPTRSKKVVNRPQFRPQKAPSFRPPPEGVANQERERDREQEREQKDKYLAGPSAPADEYPGWFRPFWDSWPAIRKRDKKLCLEICVRKVLQSRIPEVVSGVERWKLSREWQDGYVPEPSKFLRRERWKETPDAGAAKRDYMTDWAAKGAAK